MNFQGDKGGNAMIKNRLLRLEKKRFGDNYCTLKEMLLSGDFIAKVEHDNWTEEEPLPDGVKTLPDVIRFLENQEVYHEQEKTC